MKKNILLVFFFTLFCVFAESKYRFADVEYGSPHSIIQKTMEKISGISIYQNTNDVLSYIGTLFDQDNTLVVFVFDDDKLTCVNVIFNFIDVDSVLPFYADLEDTLAKKYGEPSWSARKYSLQKNLSYSFSEVQKMGDEAYTTIWDPDTEKYKTQLTMKIITSNDFPQIWLKYYSNIEYDRVQKHEESKGSIF